MIVAVETLTAMSEFAGQTESTLQLKLDAIEQLIRAYTHNNFQNRNVRFSANSIGNRVFGISPFLEVGDTIQISQSKVNDGLYTITEIGDNFTRLDKDLFTVDFNLITKIEYPADIVSGVIDIMIWEVNNRRKTGIKSETLSRYSVSYFDQDANNSVMGYPVSLLGFLKPYMKARF